MSTKTVRQTRSKSKQSSHDEAPPDSGVRAAAPATQPSGEARPSRSEQDEANYKRAVASYEQQLVDNARRAKAEREVLKVPSSDGIFGQELRVATVGQLLFALFNNPDGRTADSFASDVLATIAQDIFLVERVLSKDDTLDVSGELASHLLRLEYRAKAAIELSRRIEAANREASDAE